jgi:hypothetical protein
MTACHIASRKSLQKPGKGMVEPLAELSTTQIASDSQVISGNCCQARRLTTWHYQWMILHEFLPLFIGPALVNDILESGRRFYRPEEAYIPVEFQGAASGVRTHFLKLPLIQQFPTKPPRLVIIVSAVLAFRKYRCENTP